ncbi:MAG: hypothetical protein ACO2OW_02620 [Minisyncoccia bacterium]|jgi:type II secretory pathway component PulL
MERFKISELIPIGLLLPFLIILGIELLFVYGLSYYNQSQENFLNQKKVELDRKENEILNKIKNNEAYFVFSQYANASFLAQNKISLNTVLEKFNASMPKFLNVKNFSYDEENKEVNLNLSLRSWDEYLRFRNYLQKTAKFKIKKESYPQYDQKSGNLTFNLTLTLTPEFFK